MTTSISPYAGPVAEEALQSFFELNQQLRKGGMRNLFLAIVVIFAAAGLKSMGLVPAVWALIIIVEAYAALTVLPYLVGATPPTWVATFLTGTAGDNNKIPEGLENANKWAKKVWRFGLWTVAYASLALWVVALWNVEDNFHLILPLIASGLGVTVLAVLLFEEGNFFPWTMYLIKASFLILLLNMAAPGEWGLTVTRWVDQMRITKATKAKDQALRTSQAELEEISRQCYLKKAAKPGQIVLAEDLDRCSVEFITKQQRCLRRVEAAVKDRGPEIDGNGIATTQCLETGDWAPAPRASKPTLPPQDRTVVVPSPPAVVAPPPRVAVNTDPATWTCTPSKEFDYDPQNMFRVDFPLGPGKYEIEITGMRQQVLQRNIMANGQRTDGREWYATCLFDPDGKTHDCKERKGEATGGPLPNFSVKHEDVSRWIDRPLSVPILTEPYGKVIVRTTENKVIPIGSKGRFETKGDKFVLDLNVDPFPTNYQGHGLKGILRRCEATN